MTVEVPFYFAAVIAIFASLRVVTGSNAIHSLLYLVVSLLAVAVCFYFLGAPFAAGLEVIVYAGAILVLFVFAAMMFDLQGDVDPVNFRQQGKSNWLSIWFGPCLLATLLLVELIYIITSSDNGQKFASNLVDAKAVGILLYGPYLLAVEIASFLLLAGLVGGYHFAKDDAPGDHL